MSGAAVHSVEVQSQDSELEQAVEGPVGSFGDAPYSVQLEFFSGPMDLLLHLVARQEVPIEEVRMAVIAEQYLELVNAQAQRLDLELAGEYLVIAATLMAIKSRSLLPAEEPEDEDLGEWSDDNPFFQDLRERLKAYRLTQARANALRATPQLGVHTFARRDRKALQPTPEMLAEPEDVLSLGKLFHSLLDRIGGSSGYTIAAQPVSVVNFMVRIVDTLGSKMQALAGGGLPRRVSFYRLLGSLAEQRAGEKRTVPRMTVIGGFVAVLELMKRGLLTAAPDEKSFSVELSMSVEGESSVEDLDSEFDKRPEQTPEAEAAPAEEQSEKIVHMDAYLERKAG